MTSFPLASALERLEAPLKPLDTLKQFPKLQPIEVCPLGKNRGNCRRTEHPRAGCHVGRHAGLPGDGCPIADSQMISHAGLPAHAHPGAHPHASRYPRLPGHNSVSSHHTVVANLHKVVKLRTGLNDRVAKGGTINARIGADLYAIANKDAANLGDFTVVPAVQAAVPEAIRANDRAAVNDHPTPQRHSRVQAHVGV